MDGKISEIQNSRDRQVSWWFSSFRLAMFFAVVALLQSGWHYWIASSAVAADLRDFYAYRDSHSGKSVAGYLDIVLPAVLLGLGAGICAKNKSIQWLFIHVAFVAIGNALLMLLYVHMLPPQVTWWWPRDLGTIAKFRRLFRAFFEAFLIAAFIGHGMRLEGYRRE